MIDIQDKIKVSYGGESLYITPTIVSLDETENRVLEYICSEFPPNDLLVPYFLEHQLYYSSPKFSWLKRQIPFSIFSLYVSFFYLTLPKIRIQFFHWFRHFRFSTFLNCNFFERYKVYFAWGKEIYPDLRLSTTGQIQIEDPLGLCADLYISPSQNFLKMAYEDALYSDYTRNSKQIQKYKSLEKNLSSDEYFFFISELDT